MADVKRITEAQLADILKGFRLAVRTDGGGLVNGEVLVPENVALHVFRNPEPAAPADPEVAAIAAIVAAMDRLDGETVLLGTDVHERVIRWAMARYLGPAVG